MLSLSDTNLNTMQNAVPQCKQQHYYTNHTLELRSSTSASELHTITSPNYVAALATSELHTITILNYAAALATSELHKSQARTT